MEDEVSFAGLLEGEGKSDHFEIEVDYDVPLEQMIAAGDYRWVHPYLVKWFKVWKKEKERITLSLLSLGEASIEDILFFVTSKKVKLATLPELLAFGAKFKDEQREHPILGGPILMAIDFNYIPCLKVVDSHRILDLHCFEMDFLSNAHLLVL